MDELSVSPNGEKYRIPSIEETKQEINTLKKRCAEEREKGKKIAVVQGLGFVGAVMGAIIADAEKGDTSQYFVIGIDLPTEFSYWKIPTINKGESPFKAKDPEVDKIFYRTVIDKKNYVTSWIPEAYAEADIIVVDINLDVEKASLGHADEATVPIEPFKKAMETIGNYMKKDALVLVETTVPPGTVEHIVKPTIHHCFQKRGINITPDQLLLSHSYERVMPGEQYIDSVKRMRRTFSSINEESRKKTRKFLNDIIETNEFPLWELQKPTESEMAKVMENSYRAMNIAFIYEWMLLAEDTGVNLFEVVDSIRVRKGTHDNMMYPGFGVGGYCLTKDPLLAAWASKTLFHRSEKLSFSVDAVDVNDLMPHHTFDLLMKAMKKRLNDKKIVILGASYRKNIDDTRNSPTILLYDDIKKAGGTVLVHDPYAKKMDDRKDIRIEKDLFSTIEDADAVVFVVDHDEYLHLSMEKLVEHIKPEACVIDAFNILTDEKMNFLIDNGFVVLGVGKGHINQKFGELL